MATAALEYRWAIAAKWVIWANRGVTGVGLRSTGPT
jgi:hypothetical protein